MTEEQRAEAKAARERLRRLLDGEGYFSVYSTVPYLAKYSFDLENVLRDYFAEHPADEADPADADFVRSLGTPSRDDKDAVVVFLTPVNRTLFVRAIWESDYTHTKHRCTISIGHSDPNFIECKTRGQLRRLCDALGIKLEGAK